MAVIRWDNINTPSSRDVMAGFQSAGDNIGGGFDAIAKIISDRQKVNQGGVDRSRVAAREDFLNQLQMYKTPEALAAAQASGVLDQGVAALDPSQQSQVRGAADALLTSRRLQVGAANTFAEAQAAEVEKPLLAAHATLVAEGRNGEAAMFRAANPNVRWAKGAQEAYSTNQTRTSDARTNAVAEAAQPGKLADITNADELRPGAQVIARNGQKLTTSQQATQQTAANNLAEDQAMEVRIAAGSQAYQEQQAAGRLKLGGIAKSLGFPVDSAGAPDIANMTKEQRTKMDTAAIQAGHTKTSSDLFAGDTKAAEAMVAELRKDPTFSSAGIARNMAKIAAPFSTAAIGAPIGNDALTLATNRAQAEVAQKEGDSRNRYAPGTPDALNAYESLAKTVVAELPENVKEDGPELQKMIYELSTTGIEVAPGQFVTPSVQDVLGEFRGYDKWNFRNKTQASDIKENLKKTLQKGNVTKMLQDAEASRSANRATAVRNILGGVTNPEPKKK